MARALRRGQGPGLDADCVSHPSSAPFLDTSVEDLTQATALFRSRRAFTLVFSTHRFNMADDIDAELMAAGKEMDKVRSVRYYFSTNY